MNTFCLFPKSKMNVWHFDLSFEPYEVSIISLANQAV
jgi:hypothetical protein